MRSFLLGSLLFTVEKLSKTIFVYLKNLFSLICGFRFPVSGFRCLVPDSGFQFLGFRVAPSLTVFASHSVYTWLLSSIGRHKFSFKNILQQLLHLSLPIDCFHSRDHKLSNRRHAAILVDKQTESRFTVKMVFCMIVGCGSQSARDKHLHFA